MSKLNAVVIGAGSIGAMKPNELDSPTSKNVLTHANAFYRNPDINFVGVVDRWLGRRVDANDKWDVETYSSILEIGGAVDIVAICVPTDNHLSVLIDVAMMNPKVVIAEKPFTLSSDDAECIKKHYAGAGIPIIVNYTRRFNQHIRRLVSAIQSGAYGRCFHASLTYTRGLLRDGCHGIDLMRFFFGEYIAGAIIDAEPVDSGDIIEGSPTQMAILAFKRCQNVVFLPVDWKSYSIFEMRIATERGMIVLTENGAFIETYGIKKENIYGNYNCLQRSPHIERTDLANTLPAVAQNAVDVARGGLSLCTADDAIKVLEIYEDLTK